MNIYLLYRTNDVGHDEYTEKVIVAETEYRAREMANEHYADEGSIWTDRYKVQCEVVDLSTEHIVAECFNAG